MCPPQAHARRAHHPAYDPTGAARSAGPAHPPTAQTPSSLAWGIRPGCTPAGPGHRFVRVTHRHASNLSCYSPPSRTLDSPIARLPVGYAHRSHLGNRSCVALSAYPWCPSSSATAPCVALAPASLQSYETFPLTCPVCGATMRIIAFDVQGGTNAAGGRLPGAAITGTPVHQILDHLGEPHESPPIHPSRGPPDWINADELVFLDEDLDQDRYEIDKSSGQGICTAERCPYGWRTGTCAMNSIKG
jgi:hypothetical protein